MATQDFLAKGILIALSIAGLHLGLLGLFNFNVFEQFIPDHVKTIYIAFGAIGGWTLYTMFKK